MNLKGFFVDALSTALDNGIATPDDVLRHVGPDVLAAYLPRPLWARLLTACMGASKVDAQLVVETIGVPNLCEHVPTHMIWGVIAEVALRSLGREFVPATRESMTRSAPLAMTPPPAEKPREPIAARPSAIGPSIPSSVPTTREPSAPIAAPNATDSADVVAALENDERSSMPSRARTPTAQRFRQGNTGIGRLAANNSRRPQAPVEPPAPVQTAAPAGRQERRGSTEVTDYEIETEVGKEDWKSTLAVEDEQLVEWAAADESTQNTDDYGRKR